MIERHERAHNLGKLQVQLSGLGRSDTQCMKRAAKRAQHS